MRLITDFIATPSLLWFDEHTSHDIYGKEGAGHPVTLGTYCDHHYFRRGPKNLPSCSAVALFWQDPTYT